MKDKLSAYLFFVDQIITLSIDLKAY